MKQFAKEKRFQKAAKTLINMMLSIILHSFRLSLANITKEQMTLKVHSLSRAGYIILLRLKVKGLCLWRVIMFKNPNL